MSNFIPIYNPPFFLNKINNYEKAIYQRKGHWTEKEKIKYGVFLEIFRDKFQDRQNPILNKMFRVMSDFIKTRNHNQCRSHHQKMQRERFQIDSILESIRSKYHPREYELFFQKYSKHIKAVNSDAVLNEKGFTPHKNVEKRKRNKFNDIQSKFSSQQGLPRKTDESKISKIQNVEQNVKVLIQVNAQIFDKKQCQIIKKLGDEIQIDKKIKSDEEISQEFVEKKNQAQKGQMNEQKKPVAQKKTQEDYGSDSDEDNESKIVPDAIPQNIQKDYQKNVINSNMGFGLGMNPEYMNQINSIPSNSHFGIQSLQSYPINESQFPPSLRMNNFSIGFQQDYSISVKDLQQRKKWHLSQANRLYNEMNQHLQRANNCQQMKQMMVNQIMDFRRGLYYPNGFSNSQF